MESESTTLTELLPTRYSLLSRLQNWEDQESWRVFFDTYWRLIYSVALKSGLFLGAGPEYAGVVPSSRASALESPAPACAAACGAGTAGTAPPAEERTEPVSAPPGNPYTPTLASDACRKPCSASSQLLNAASESAPVGTDNLAADGAAVQLAAPIPNITSMVATSGQRDAVVVMSSSTRAVPSRFPEDWAACLAIAVTAIALGGRAIRSNDYGGARINASPHSGLRAPPTQPRPPVGVTHVRTGVGALGGRPL